MWPSGFHLPAVVLLSVWACVSASSLTLSLLLHVADAQSHGHLLLAGSILGAGGLGHHLLPLQHLALSVVSAARLAGLKLAAAACRQKEQGSGCAHTGRSEDGGLAADLRSGSLGELLQLCLQRPLLLLVQHQLSLQHSWKCSKTSESGQR